MHRVTWLSGSILWGVWILFDDFLPGAATPLVRHRCTVSSHQDVCCLLAVGMMLLAILSSLSFGFSANFRWCLPFESDSMHRLHLCLGLKFIRRAFSGVNLAFGMLTRECFLECTFNWLDYSTGIKDETQTHCFTGFSRMVSLVIPNVGLASLLTQSPHLILGCAWTAATLLMALQGLVCPVEV